jgi:hypothetical protein
MAYPQMRPQKRKNDDSTSYAGASKKPKKPTATAKPENLTHLTSYYQAIPANFLPYMQLHTSRSQPPNPQFTYPYDGAPTNTAYKDAVIANAWLQEWQTIPKGFEPSRPLSLLNEPTSIDMGTYVRKTSRVYLNHWDRDHEPEGTSSQRLAIRKKRLKKLSQVLVFEELKQEAKRSKVKQAVQNAEVIDLTEDDGIRNEALWRHPAFENVENYPPRYGGQDQKTLDALFHQDRLFAQLSMDPSAYSPSYTRPHPQTTFGRSHH